MGEEDAEQICEKILVSHKKQQNWVICRDVDGPRECHTEWNESEREKQILYINAYLWNLEKHIDDLIGEQRHKHREQLPGSQGGKGQGVKNWEVEIDLYTRLILCIK